MASQIASGEPNRSRSEPSPYLTVAGVASLAALALFVGLLAMIALTASGDGHSGPDRDRAFASKFGP